MPMHEKKNKRNKNKFLLNTIERELLSEIGPENQNPLYYSNSPSWLCPRQGGCGDYGWICRHIASARVVRKFLDKPYCFKDSQRHVGAVMRICSLIGETLPPFLTEEKSTLN